MVPKDMAEALTLETKMNTFRRSNMLQGLNSTAATHKETMATLNALD